MKNLLYLVVAAFIFLAMDAHAGECQDSNWDHWLLEHLDGSRKELTPERMIAIRKMIDEVYQLEQSQAQQWYEEHYRKCSAENDA